VNQLPALNPEYWTMRTVRLWFKNNRRTYARDSTSAERTVHFAPPPPGPKPLPPFQPRAPSPPAGPSLSDLMDQISKSGGPPPAMVDEFDRAAALHRARGISFANPWPSQKGGVMDFHPTPQRHLFVQGNRPFSQPRQIVDSVVSPFDVSFLDCHFAAFAHPMPSDRHRFVSFQYLGRGGHSERVSESTDLRLTPSPASHGLSAAATFIRRRWMIHRESCAPTCCQGRLWTQCGAAGSSSQAQRAGSCGSLTRQ
jgi:hypothetical protein